MKQERIEDWEISIRTANVLRNAGIETIHDLQKITELECLNLPGIGRKAVNELKQEVLTPIGAQFRPPEPESPLLQLSRLTARCRSFELQYRQSVQELRKFLDIFDVSEIEELD